MITGRVCRIDGSLALILPALAGFLLFLIVGPSTPLLARLIRVAILLSCAAVFLVELLSIPAQASQLGLALGWSAIVVVLAVIVAGKGDWRRLRRVPWSTVVRAARSLRRSERVGIAIILVMFLGTLVASQVYLPNTVDSLTYHLGRIEHWRVNQSVSPYPALIWRQVALAPGAEYLQFTLRMLGDSIWLTPVPSWLFGLGCVFVGHRIAGQLGVGRAGQMMAAVAIATMPAVVLMASGTSNDLPAAFFTAAFVSLVLELHQGPGSLRLTAVTAAALGMGVLTKTTVVPLALGFGLWWAWLLLKSRFVGLGRGIVGGLVLGVLAGPYLAQNITIWGHPGGPPDSANVALLKQHDPVTVAMNAAKIASAELVSPELVLLGPYVCSGTRAIHRLAGRTVYDPNTEYGTNPWRCGYHLDENFAASAFHCMLMLGAMLVLLAVGTPLHRGYAGLVTLGLLAFAAMLTYQPWVARLLTASLVLAMPLIPVAAARLFRRCRRAAVGPPRLAFSVLLVIGMVLPGLIALGGMPRSLFLPGYWTRAEPLRLVAARPDISGAVRALRDIDARRIGISGDEETPEVALWMLLGTERTTLIPVRSVIPGRPARPAGDLDAVVCISSAPNGCGSVAPASWRSVRFNSPGPEFTVVAFNPRVRR